MSSCFLAGFLAAFTFKGLFLVFLAIFFLNTFPVPFFFKLSNVVDLSDMATCFLDFSIFFAVQGAADLTSVFFKGQSWNPM